jgi:uncharacterized protein YwqG
MLTRDELLTQIHNFDLDAYANLIMSGVKTAIHIRRERVDESRLPLGASKLGGSPDVPADFTWPLYQNKPLTFMGQFRLSEVAPYDVDRRLPDQGMLYVFYDEEAQPWGFKLGEEEASRVLYTADENTPLHRFMHPTAKGTYGYVEALPACSLTYFQIVTPQYSDDRLRDYEGASWDVIDRYFTFMSKVDELQSSSRDKAAPSHWLLGNPLPVQGDPLVNAIRDHATSAGQDLKTIDRWAATEWCLLLQIDTDDAPDQGLDVMWGDVGRLYFCMPKADLAAYYFANVRCVLQCT